MSKVYCGNCEYYESNWGGDSCNHPKNMTDTFHAPKEHRVLSPSEKNESNNCDDWEIEKDIFILGFRTKFKRKK